MNKITIEIPRRNWEEFSKQGIVGKIVRYNNEIKIEVEVVELPGEYVEFSCVFPEKLSDDLINRTVIGDIGDKGFYIRVLCFSEDITIQ
jgi:hypothetical protein